MNQLKLIFRSISHFWVSHVAVALGVAICTMVITGTLIVGDSVRSSLEETTQLRLGKTEYLFDGIDRYFRVGLAREVNQELNIHTAPLLQLNGFASAQGGKLKLNNVKLIGIDQNFQHFQLLTSVLSPPSAREAFISENLAQRLQLKEGDALLLRVDKASQIPKNAPFVTDQENQISIRLNVKKILSANELGRFNIRTSQTAPFNVFVSLSFLNEEMELEQKANKILINTAGNADKYTIQRSLQKHWSTQDMALDIRDVQKDEYLEITSERVFLDSGTVAAITDLAPESQAILTYMINSFSANGKETPYSFMSAGPVSNNNNITINRWMADDLDAKPGDSIRINYFVIGPLRKLVEKSTWFKVASIVDMEGIFADPTLMPDLPGMSDAGNCRDWEAGVPIQLEKIRDKDEDYWNKHRGTPKAFISYESGKELWQNRFGVATSIRINKKTIDGVDLSQKLAEALPPEAQGFKLSSVKEEGLAAARGGVDFGQLFMALSFFLLVAGIILMGLLFNLNLEKRIAEVGTLKALGFTRPTIQRLILSEGLMVAFPGVLLGTLMAYLYNKLIFEALNTVWQDIVMTDILEEVILPSTLALGIVISFALVAITLWYNTNKSLRLESSSLQRRIISQQKRGTTWLRIAGWFSGIAALALLAFEAGFGQTLNTAIFFISGGLLLLSFLLLSALSLRTSNYQKIQEFTLATLLIKNLSRNRPRSMRIITLFTVGTFIIISTGLNKKDLHQGSEDPTSGTGGFQYYMESTIPVLKDLNVNENREEQGIEIPLKFVQLRKSDGDDASCLNLNRVASPQILGLNSSALKGRFSIVKHTDDLDPGNPWASLKNELPGGVVPAILDQTVIQWGLGKKVGDTLVYLNEAGEELHLKIVGGLANSIFQGNALIEESLFLKHFPSSSGSHILLIDATTENPEGVEEELQRAFRNYGIDLQSAADRLAMFNQVENTYLSIFLLLGGLAMILGTVGLGISLARNILDRGKEIGIMRAIGYTKNIVLRMIVLEHLILLLLGTLAGAGTAFIATLPSILSEFVQASWQTAAVIVLLILLNGLGWIYVITRNYLKKDLLVTLREE